MEFVTTNGYPVQVDDCDAVLSYYNWTAQVRRGRVTAVLRTVVRGGHQLTDYLHRIVWSRASGGKFPERIDHKNRNPLDNRRNNLREASAEQNMHNRTCRGVEFDKNCKLPWRVRFEVGGVRHSFGRYATLDEARQVYERESRRLHGEFSAV